MNGDGPRWARPERAGKTTAGPSGRPRKYGGARGTAARSRRKDVDLRRGLRRAAWKRDFSRPVLAVEIGWCCFLKSEVAASSSSSLVFHGGMLFCCCADVFVSQRRSSRFLRCQAFSWPAQTEV